MAECFPLHWPEGWPRTQDTRRTSSRFGKNLGPSQFIELTHELRLFGASSIVVSSNVPVRNDGVPYAQEGRRKVADPGVAVWFTIKGKSMSMARDPYQTPWENVRSLVMAVRYLRGLERHGGSTMVERAFSGFQALPAPTLNSRRPWWQVLELTPEASKAAIDASFRKLIMIRHPDRGGSTDMVVELNEARAEALAAAA